MKLLGDWPGTRLTATTMVGGEEYYYHTFSDVTEFNIIFNNGSGAQTADINGITADSYFDYDGQRQATQLSAVDDVTITPTAGALEVFTIDGRRLHGVQSTSDLPRGLYIINRRKTAIR